MKVITRRQVKKDRDSQMGFFLQNSQHMQHRKRN